MKNNKIPTGTKAKRIYYIILMVLLTMFVGCNWCKAINFTFFDSFDGYNFLFILWIVMLILPVFGIVDVLGVKIKHPFDVNDDYKNKADEAATTAQSPEAEDNIKQEIEKMMRGDKNGK